jgi:uncharacterized protein involved in exopolysaccharide biosynthesis
VLEVLRILARWRRPLVGLALAAAIGAAIYAYSVEPRYYAEASILPPVENPGFGGLSTLLQQYQIPIPGGTSTPFLPTLYASIVQSRNMGKRILDEFTLRPVFAASTESDALEMLRSRTFLKYTDDGLFLVGYQDADAERGAAIVNAYVRNLDDIIQEVNSGRAGQTRQFVESQIARCRTDLERAEEALRDFQRQHHAVQIDAQTQGAIGLAAELQGRILAAQVELDLLRQRAQPTAPEVRNKTRELEALRAQYNELVATKPVLGRGDAAADGNLFPSFDAVPDLALQYVRLMRELKVQETLYALLVQQLETARLEEQKNTPVLSVLDWAAPGEIPVYPRKMLLVALAAVAAAVWVGIFAVAVETLRARRVAAPEAAATSALAEEWRRAPAWLRRLEQFLVR